MTTIVTMQDARAVRTPTGRGYCSRGIRAFFARHGLDFQDFLRNGIAAEKLEATGDHMALKAVEVARGRQQ